MRSRTRRAHAALAVLPLALTLALAGCSSGSDQKDVASAATGKASGAKEAKDGEADGPDGDGRDKALQFAKCMRDNGVPMEDPKDDGRFVLELDKNTNKADVDKAMKACRQFQPAAKGKGKIDPKAAEAMRKLAQCMRENGVEGFPDPAAGGGIKMDRSVGEDPDFKAADEKCKSMRPKKPEGQ
ncbi:hypothetical protein ACFYT4_15615 [Streptomyces sp. NPDC004609]|uniref:hypothetical protein n=1 Tax=Streptomyces sp. NPDC004609 TaxID=3364704 RepID=UPI0036C4C5E6